MLTVCSMFRDSVDNLPRYFGQIHALKEHTDVRLVIAEGDSTDNTYGELIDWIDNDDILLKFNHGGPKYGSFDIPARWLDISKVIHQIKLALEYRREGTLVWVESDLIWKPEDILKLVDDLHVNNDSAVAPYVAIQGTNKGYDTWGMKVHGGPIPFVLEYDYGVVPIDSCGSCFVTRDWETFLNWDGRWPYKAGGRLYLDCSVVIYHP